MNLQSGLAPTGESKATWQTSGPEPSVMDGMRDAKPIICWAQLVVFACATFAHSLHNFSFLGFHTSCQATVDSHARGCCTNSGGEGQSIDVRDSSDVWDTASGRSAAHCDCTICQFHRQGKLPQAFVGPNAELGATRTARLCLCATYPLPLLPPWSARGPPALDSIELEVVAWGNDARNQHRFSHRGRSPRHLRA